MMIERETKLEDASFQFLTIQLFFPLRLFYQSFSPEI